jgi:hypothetical protein
MRTLILILLVAVAHEMHGKTVTRQSSDVHGSTGATLPCFSRAAAARSMNVQAATIRSIERLPRCSKAATCHLHSHQSLRIHSLYRAPSGILSAFSSASEEDNTFSSASEEDNTFRISPALCSDLVTLH